MDKQGVVSNADGSSPHSVAMARAIARRIGDLHTADRLPGQRAGAMFEEHVLTFLKQTFLSLGHLRPGAWEITKTGDRIGIAAYQQYGPGCLATANRA